YVKGASMEPNFFDHEYLIIDEISYRLGEVKRGDVIVFVPPTATNGFYIKRVIGLPGETVQIEEGIIKIYNDEYPSGFVLSEEYIDEYTHGIERVVLGLDEVYVLGDNRGASLDSRKIGPIKIDSIVGRAWLRGLPIDRAGVIGVPKYE
ncbi:signal peptidase I, partial [Patescibacteria group bacterium]|nr:signal peptidase I [Patescibacteria group bacterium]